MGTSISGVISRPISGFDIKMLDKLLRCKLQPIDVTPIWKLVPKFDTRNKEDVRICWSPNFLLIANSTFSDNLLFNSNIESYNHFLNVTGMRGKAVFFCIYDSGGSYGFSMFENGKVIRQRLYSISGPKLRSVVHGVPLAVEQPWHPAVLTEKEKQDFDPEEIDGLFRNQENQKLLSEYNLNKFLVDAVLKEEFCFNVEDDVTHDQTFQDKFYRAT